MAEKEEWRTYRKGPRVIWEVSNCGNVKRNGEDFEPRISKKGYLYFSNFVGIHRAVAELFVPNPENKPQVDHIDGNKLNNHYLNLQWVTNKENCNNPITKQNLRGKNPWNKGLSTPEETRKKQSKVRKEWLRTHEISEETRKKQSKTIKEYWKIHKHPSIGRIPSEEENKKRRESQLIRFQDPEIRIKNGNGTRNTHRVYHDDGTWHMEKNT